jgi:hypothetical protein
MELLDKQGNVEVVLDPMAPLSVPVNSFSTFTALDAVYFSPIFANYKWTVGSKELGTVQWGEAVERASFWNYPGTAFPNWHIQMNLTMLPEQKITVPFGSWQVHPTLPGVYEVDQFVLKFCFEVLVLNYPTGVPIMLTYNIEQSTAVTCCAPGARGFHSHVIDSLGNTIPYIWASYMDPTPANPNPDLNPLSHEVAEFMHNPMNNNTVSPGWPSPGSFTLLAGPPYWNPPYTFTQCDSGFEVGDPIEDRGEVTRLFTVPQGPMTYHFQNIVTASWMMRASPSFSVNNQYAFPNTVDGEFYAPAPVCPTPKK